jgi:ABC-type amino acid transport substrate-binding protein
VPTPTFSRRQWTTAAIAIAAVLLLASFFLVNSNDDEAWARIQQRGLITFATDPTYPPFEALDANGDFFGFDIDLARAVAERLGLKAEFEAVSYDGLIGTLVVGRDDAVISAFVIQPERGKEASFTPPYFNAGVVLVTRAGQAGRFALSHDAQKWAAGKTLAAEYGSQGDALIRKWSRLAAGLTPVSAPDSAAAMQAVIDGQADGALVDSVAAFEFLQSHPELKIAASIPEAEAPYAIAVSAKSPALLRELTRALNEMEADGSLGELRVKWFGEAAR